MFVFAIGLQTLQHSSDIVPSSLTVSCDFERALHLGSSLINFINTVCIIILKKHCSLFLHIIPMRVCVLFQKLFFILEYMEKEGMKLFKLIICKRTCIINFFLYLHLLRFFFCYALSLFFTLNGYERSQKNVKL